MTSRDPASGKTEQGCGDRAQGGDGSGDEEQLVEAGGKLAARDPLTSPRAGVGCPATTAATRGWLRVSPEDLYAAEAGVQPKRCDA